MASFDVTSLFTNIPLTETTNIIVNNICEDHLSTFGLDRLNLAKLLELATVNGIFTFDGKLYNQIDGVAMGSSLGPVYADCFMGFYEKIWLSECPDTFKPLYYRRYVDDTFLVFKDLSHVELFLAYLNSRHPNIIFTCETEKESKLPFLDAQILRNGGKFESSVFRKSTFTGLGLNYLSYSSKLYKLNSIRTLINRAYNVCSSFTYFHHDMVFLLNYFTENAYPAFIFYKDLRNFLDDKFCPKPTEITVKKDVKYIKLPYLGHNSYVVRKKLQEILKPSFPQVDFRFVFTNSFTIGSLLRERATLPADLNSCVVYLFTCSQCALRYVGCSSRWLRHRILEHRGLSIRTQYPLSKPSFSAIREHSLSQDHVFTNQDFSILSLHSNRLDLVISESLFIKKMRPELNNNASSFQLSIA